MWSHVIRQNFTDVSEEMLPPSNTLEIASAHSSETSANLYSTNRHILRRHFLHRHRREDLKSHIFNKAYEILVLTK
jgi:hypothetical protein